jgi:CheY-like chemotaxis protein
MVTVLIVDDVDLSREYLSILLRRHGYRVLEAGDGDQALRVMRAERPDLAIVDLLMPAMDGFEFVRAVRGDASIARTPVIFLTANFPSRDVTPLARALGVRHVIQKSCPLSQILDAVREEVNSLTPPAVSVPEGEYRREHFRLISGKLAEEFEGLAKAFGDLLRIGENPAPSESEVTTGSDAGPPHPDAPGPAGDPE